MRIQDAAARLGVTPRTLRHYEAQGLLVPLRDANGYRRYTQADLMRAERIRDMIATGYSTREIQAIAPCLDDANSTICDGAVTGLEHKLGQIDRLIGELSRRRQAVAERLASLKASLGDNDQESEATNESTEISSSFPHRVSPGGGRVPARTNPHPHRQ